MGSSAIREYLLELHELIVERLKQVSGESHLPLMSPLVKWRYD